MSTNNLENEKIYRSVNDQMIEVETPKTGYGQQIITWVNGKITSIDVTSKLKI